MNTQSVQTGQATDLAKHQEPCGAKAKWAATIDDRYVPAPQRKLPAKVLMNEVNLPTGSVLVRDLGGEHDVAIEVTAVLDLAEGNVFYTVPECEAPKPTGCHAAPKLAFFVDDRPEETLLAEQTGQTLRELFGFTPDVLLFRDYESPNDQPIGLADATPYADGPVFYTRRPQRHTITIKINGKDYELHQEKAKAPVKELKKLAGIPLADVLVNIVAGQMVPLDDNAVIELRCGAVFVSHPRDNASS